MYVFEVRNHFCSTDFWIKEMNLTQRLCCRSVVFISSSWTTDNAIFPICIFRSVIPRTALSLLLNIISNPSSVSLFLRVSFVSSNIHFYLVSGIRNPAEGRSIQPALLNSASAAGGSRRIYRRLRSDESFEFICKTIRTERSRPLWWAFETE